MDSNETSNKRMEKGMKVLGISCFYHDSAVVAVEDGQILFAIHEERLSRHKHDARFPILGVSKALEACRWSINDVDKIVFYENPNIKLGRIFDQVVSGWPSSWRLFSEHLPRFYRFKFPFERIVRDKLRYKNEVLFSEHHRCHAGSAFFTSPFEKALIMTVDGVGEYETLTAYIGQGNHLKKIKTIHFPDSLGLLYSVFTQYLGFRVNNGEYKVMGLAPYGQPQYYGRILGEILHLRKDGSFYLNQKYFDFNDLRFHYRESLVKHLGVLPRSKDEPIEVKHKDLAASIQKALETALLHILKTLLKDYPYKNLCLAGGVALNCTANTRIVRELGINVHIQPAAGDAGGALGAAFEGVIDSITQVPYRFPFSPYLGTEYSDKAIQATLAINGVPHQRMSNIYETVARLLAEGNIVAVVHGRDEWGPRALGNRSILADPRRAEMKDHLNAKIKFREDFRPFAPVIMREHYGDYFETLNLDESPYMLFTHKVLQSDKIPAATHVNKTGRVQTVSVEQNSCLYSILEEFYKLTGVPVLINTSFNLRGEPIVSSPSDALKTFYASGIDFLVLENYLVEKAIAHNKRVEIVKC